MKFRVNPALRADQVQIGDDFYKAGQTYTASKASFAKDLAELVMPVEESERVEDEAGRPSYVTATVAHPVFVTVDE